MQKLLLFLLIQALALAEDFSSANNRFTAAIYDELLGTDSNLVVSPFSLETALALTQSGARDATGAEIRAALYLPETQAETDSLMKSILPTLEGTNYTLHSINKAYVEEGFQIKEGFKSTATSVYGAQFANVEFAQNVEAADEINQWVEEETDGKIRDLLAADDLDDNTRLVLLNALYFQGTWLYPFDSGRTKKAQFFTTGDETVETEMMSQSLLEYNYYESEELGSKFLEVPFQGGATMTFVLPNEKDGIEKLEKQKERLLSISEYSVRTVDVSLPKFKIESSVNFNDILEKLGIRKAFDPLQADFSGIAGDKGDLFVGMVKQKTFIDVDENGVSAAAATAVVIDYRVASEVKFVADHPFMFYIKVKDVVLFEGRVLEP